MSRSRHLRTTSSTPEASTHEDGASTIEYVGATVLVAVLIGVVFAVPYAKHLIPGTQASVCTITTGNDAHREDGTCINDNSSFIKNSEAQPQKVDQPISPTSVKSRQEILERANFWAQNPRPYSMTNYSPGPNGGMYRTDCSGFVSMAWGLPAPGLSTVTLPGVSHQIPKDDLQPGDILLKGGAGTEGAYGHVVLFLGWTDDSHTSYHAVEQAGGVGTTSRVISYPYDHDSSYVPYRKDGL